MYIGLPNLLRRLADGRSTATPSTPALAENVLDHRLNCRTVYMNPINRYLYWNMNYHVEHHMFPLVPYHNLPKLHELVKADMPTPYNGLLEAYREIIPAVLRQVRDPGYYVKRKLPTPTCPGRCRARSRAAFTAEGKPVVGGWVEVCDSASCSQGRRDPLRSRPRAPTPSTARRRQALRHRRHLHARQRPPGRWPGQGHAHRVRQAQRPLRHPRRLAAARCRSAWRSRPMPCARADGKIFLDLNSAGGYGVTEPPTPTPSAWSATRTSPRSSRNWCWSRSGELAALAYQPGDYLQFDIPAYAEQQLRGPGSRSAVRRRSGRRQHVFDFAAANPIACRRNYSFATNPAADRQLRFNVRIATPPRGQDCRGGRRLHLRLRPQAGRHGHARSARSAISTSGRAEREMVYLGGGAGMAPLRSHLSHLLETQKTDAPRQLLVWCALAAGDVLPGLLRGPGGQDTPTSRFHLALSEPQPDGQLDLLHRASSTRC